MNGNANIVGASRTQMLSGSCSIQRNNAITMGNPSVVGKRLEAVSRRV
jgi:hypothetical protein